MKRTLTLLTVLMVATVCAAPAATVTRITVNGEGTVAVMPDQASVRASIIVTADRAEDAVSQANTTYARAVGAAVAEGVARDDITLAYYNLNYNPRPAAVPNQPAPEGRYGYTVTRTFDVKVRNVNKSGSVVDALTSAGVTNIESVSFGTSEPARVRGQAIARAMADAQAKAQEAAKAAGLHITGIGEILFGSAQNVVPMMKTMALNAGPAPTVFDQGNVNITADLAVIFLAQP